MKGMILVLLVMVVSLIIASLWNSIPVIKDSIHFILDPTAGFLLNLNPHMGMFAIVFAITLLTTLAQKYGTDQEALRKIKQEQKLLQEEAKKIQRAS